MGPTGGSTNSRKQAWRAYHAERALEALARAGRESYIILAGTELTNAIIDNHEAPMVLSSIMKQSCTERGRRVVTDGMDILGGAGISRAWIYQETAFGALDPDGGASDLDYLQELIAIQSGGPKNLGFFGTRNMGFLHQELVEILSYALVLTENHIFTSGATGTNAAVIRGALRAERPDLLTVILPQSLEKQPEESRELLEQVENVVERGEKDHLPLGEASRLCNEDIVGRVQQVICFAFHDSNTLLDTCMEAKMKKKIVTLFYLD